MRIMKIAAGVLAGSLALSASAHAAMLTASLGNTASGFADGDTPTVAEVGTAQAGQPVPFDQGYGTDGLFGGNFMQSWTFTYAALTQPVLSASLTLGIYDHDSSATGSQLALFTADGNDLTATLDAQFEAGGGSLDLEYNVYTVDLAGLFADLTDGMLTVVLNLDGPGLVTPLFPLPGPNPPVETDTNGANLIFSSLMIETRDPDTPVPAPGTLPLAALGLGLMLWRRRGLALAAARRR
jgi:uncharacterized protein (TIGR03382 family)